MKFSSNIFQGLIFFFTLIFIIAANANAKFNAKLADNIEIQAKQGEFVNDLPQFNSFIFSAIDGTLVVAGQDVCTFDKLELDFLEINKIEYFIKKAVVKNLKCVEEDYGQEIALKSLKIQNLFVGQQIAAIPINARAELAGLNVRIGETNNQVFELALDKLNFRTKFSEFENGPVKDLFEEFKILNIHSYRLSDLALTLNGLFFDYKGSDPVLYNFACLLEKKPFNASFKLEGNSKISSAKLSVTELLNIEFILSLKDNADELLSRDMKLSAKTVANWINQKVNLLGVTENEVKKYNSAANRFYSKTFDSQVMDKNSLVKIRNDEMRFAELLINNFPNRRFDVPPQIVSEFIKISDYFLNLADIRLEIEEIGMFKKISLFADLEIVINSLLDAIELDNSKDFKTEVSKFLKSGGKLVFNAGPVDRQSAIAAINMGNDKQFLDAINLTVKHENSRKNFLPKKNKIPSQNSSLSLQDAKRECAEIGFKKGTEKFADCVMRFAE